MKDKEVSELEYPEQIISFPEDEAYVRPVERLKPLPPDPEERRRHRDNDEPERSYYEDWEWENRAR